MTPSYYNKWTSHSHCTTDVELGFNFPVAQFNIMAYGKRLKETYAFCWSRFEDIQLRMYMKKKKHRQYQNFQKWFIENKQQREGRE